MCIGQLVELGKQPAAGQQAEVHPVEIREHRHVDADPLGDRSDRVHADDPAPGAEQREVGPAHARHEHVGRRSHLVEEPRPGDGPGQPATPAPGSAIWARSADQPSPVQLLLLLGHPGRLRDGVEPAHRVVDVAGQRDQHARDLVAQLLVLAFGTGRDRHHGHQRPLGPSRPASSSRRRNPPETQARITSFTVASKTRPTSFTSSSGTDSDGVALPVRDRAVERGPRRGEETRRRLLAPGRPARGCACRGPPPPPLRPGACSASHPAGGPARRPRAAASARWTAAAAGSTPSGSGTTRVLGVQVEEGGQHGGAAHPVEDGVMHLGHQRRAITLQTLDHVHLPQRPVGVERAAHHRGHEGVQLGLARPATAGWPGSGGRRARSRGRRPRPGGAARRAPGWPAAGTGRPGAAAAG